MMPITPAQLLGFLASSEAFSKLDFVQSQVGLHWIWSSCAGGGCEIATDGCGISGMSGGDSGHS